MGRKCKTGFAKKQLYYEETIKEMLAPTLKLLQLLFLPDKQSGFLQFIQGS
jgi:hypothetical protein